MCACRVILPAVACYASCLTGRHGGTSPILPYWQTSLYPRPPGALGTLFTLYELQSGDATDGTGAGVDLIVRYMFGLVMFSLVACLSVWVTAVDEVCTHACMWLRGCLGTMLRPGLDSVLCPNFHGWFVICA